ncbi:MAG TPA: helix-turn-helix domain-containing protein [Thermodesulfobacteriota bacterium]|nr:helix-turn-helix domain-containing protein [Thermodesulfobacteriota bacterium]
MTQTYGHFCPVARTLEKIGDKWTLLIIRDLLPGPQRFTDLLGYLNAITPKWLTRRLRDLESAGIVERDSQPGRRQIWYRLTPAGRDLSPIVESLAAWGFRYAMRPPTPGEVVHPDKLIQALTLSLNQKGKRLARPTGWMIRFAKDHFSLSFDGEKWASCRTEILEADLVITTTPEMWATVFTAPRSDRSRLAKNIQVEGESRHINEFKRVFGLRDREEEKALDTVKERLPRRRALA